LPARQGERARLVGQALAAVLVQPLQPEAAAVCDQARRQ
jgi:hypothetical protein